MPLMPPPHAVPSRPDARPADPAGASVSRRRTASGTGVAPGETSPSESPDRPQGTLP
jgi:hypothetical protein